MHWYRFCNHENQQGTSFGLLFPNVDCMITTCVSFLYYRNHDVQDRHSQTILSCWVWLQCYLCTIFIHRDHTCHDKAWLSSYRVLCLASIAKKISIMDCCYGKSSVIYIVCHNSDLMTLQVSLLLVPIIKLRLQYDHNSGALGDRYRHHVQLMIFVDIIWIGLGIDEWSRALKRDQDGTFCIMAE